mmetsp:Transcript_11308/g.24922  ORF Transcript_11308/g.24922 Transcript_11308/m.24922 type:complete len:263 (+) Transcript_11308:1040-1828(+)
MTPFHKVCIGLLYCVCLRPTGRHDFASIGILNHLHEEATLVVVKGGQGHLLLEPDDGRMLRRILVLFIYSGCLHPCVDEERAKHEMHEKHGMHEVFAHEEEGQSEDHSTADAEIQGPMLQVTGRVVDGEYQMEDKEVVERQHPLEHVPAHPHEALLRAKIEAHPAVAAACAANPKERVQGSSFQGQRFEIPVHDEVVQGDQSSEDEGECEPSRPILPPEQGVVVVLGEDFIERELQAILRDSAEVLALDGDEGRRHRAGGDE